MGIFGLAVGGFFNFAGLTLYNDMHDKALLFIVGGLGVMLSLFGGAGLYWGLRDDLKWDRLKRDCLERAIAALDEPISESDTD